MNRNKYISLIFGFYNLLVYCCCTASPSKNLHDNLAVNKFQDALLQQNIYTILTSIEERLRNLDNIYSMQLSQTLESKLDQYNRKLESLDSKIIRFEALVMLNLDKISENISTKNFKDDISKTNSNRKLDYVYEGISHRLSYMDRKYDTSFGKIQENIDKTINHLDKMEESMAKRDSDLEGELSHAIFAIDNMKTTYNTMEEKLLNITESTLNISRNNHILLTRYNSDMRKSVNKLHDNIVGNLQYIDNKTSGHIKISEDSNTVLKQMKIELKEDFNNYANKVADMNSDLWKNSDTAEDDLKLIAAAVNSTKIDLQNGVRALILQIGKISSKDNGIPLGTNRYDNIDKKLDSNFEKILTNQDVFLESCHRLQMDESQIESEISKMLNKLIDMLEKKLASETKDIKIFEKALKNHDSRINRNLFQANSNIISLFEKSTTSNQMLTTEIRKVGSDLDALFTFVQSTLAGGYSSPTTVSMKLMSDQLNRIESYTKHLVNNQQTDPLKSNVTLHNVQAELHKLARSLLPIIQIINNNTTNCFQKNDADKFLHDVLKNYSKKPNLSKNMTKTNSVDHQKIDKDIEEAVMKVFGPNLNSSTTEQSQLLKVNSKKCKQKIRNLIDIRADVEGCANNGRKPSKKAQTKKKAKRPFPIDVRGESTSSEVSDYIEYDYDQTTENLELTEEMTSVTTTQKNDIQKKINENSLNTTMNILQ